MRRAVAVAGLLAGGLLALSVFAFLSAPGVAPAARFLREVQLGEALPCIPPFCTKPGEGFPPSLKPGCLKPDGSNVDLWCPGDGGYGCYKIPVLLRTQKGTLLAMIEARKYSCDDHGYIDLLLRRSFDGGETWAPSALVHGNSTAKHWTSVGDAQMVQDSTTGVIWLFHARNNSQLFRSHSADDGASWSEPENVTGSLKLRNAGWIGSGHAGGLQLSSGPTKGRLIVPVYSNKSYAIYSDDHGKSWHMVGLVTGRHSWSAENAMSETGHYAADGTPILLVSERNNEDRHRVQALSIDGGISWGEPWEAKDLPEPIRGCEGALVYHPGTGKLYFSHPDPPLKLLRTRLRIWTSSDMGRTWQHHATVWKKAAGYSAMVVMGAAKDAELGLLYDRNDHPMMIFEAQGVSFTTVPVESAAPALVGRPRCSWSCPVKNGTGVHWCTCGQCCSKPSKADYCGCSPEFCDKTC
jgi:sialidase-1